MRVKQVGQCTVKILPDRASLGKTGAEDVAQAILAFLQEKPLISIVFASAPSQNEFLACLQEDTRIDWQRIVAFNMDEYVGIDPEAPQGFGRFLITNLYEAVRPKDVILFNSLSEQPQQECDRLAQLLQSYDPDIVIYGIGENGHLAFNDPPVADFEDKKLVKLVQLDPICRQQQVNDGCFSNLSQVPTQAYTLTIPALLRARAMFGMVPGKTKIEAVDKTLNDPISTTCPASIIRTHPHATLYLDEVSASKVK